MKFEEILPMLRAGVKASNPTYGEKGDYWIAGYVQIMNFEEGEEENPKIFTLHRCNKEGKPYVDSKEWGIPRWLVMDDEWEINNDSH